MKINLVNNGIFPIVYDKNGELINEDLDTGFNIAGTVQGEGKLVGTPCLFIRTSGCNIRCWVDNGSQKYKPIIIPSNGCSKVLEESDVGTKILAIDEKTGEIVETTIVGYREDETDEYYKIIIEGLGEIFVTEEHPFLTNKGWVEAKNLKENDVLEEISTSQVRKFKFSLYPKKAGEEARKKMSESMIKNNPIHFEGVKEKIYSHENYINSRKQSGINSGKFRRENNINWKTYLSDERIKQLCLDNSERMKLNNPMFNVETVKKMIQTRDAERKMSGNELKMLEIIDELGLENDIWFCGHGGYFITKDNKCRVPDFKIHKKNKIIEVTEPYYFRPDFEKYKIESEEFYNNCGYEVLVLNMKDDIEELKKEILHFVRNGYKIEKIKKIKRKAKTFNIQCEPYNNYLIKKNNKYIINHNCIWINGNEGSPCDTLYSSHKPETNKLEIEDIISILKHNLKNSKIKHLVISGGEPFLQLGQLQWLLKRIKEEFKIHITVETNGTIYSKECLQYIDLISLSPKLSNSDPTEEKFKGDEIEKNELKYSEIWERKHKQLRMNYSALQQIIDTQKEFGNDIQFKFVVSKEKDLEEIREVENNLSNIVSTDIMLMPEGYFPDEIMKKSLWITQECVKHGYSFTTRLHTLMFGTKRSV